MKQASVSAEQVVRADLSRQVALAIDYASLNGSGTSNQPLGIQQNGSITTLQPYGANSGNPDWGGIVAQETAVAIGNADVGSLSYMTSCAGRGKLKGVVKNAGTGYPIYLCENNQVNGYPLLATNQIPSNLTVGTSTDVTNMTFGNWSDLAIALFGALDILVDPYTGSSSGTVRLCIFQDADIKVRHEASFCNLLFRK
jgi:HK97 family phage major capsid protein